MDVYRERYSGYEIATPGYAPPVPYGMSQVNIDGNGGGRPLPPQPTVKVYCRANPNYAMSVRNGAIVLAPANPKDDYQASYWLDMSFFFFFFYFLSILQDVLPRQQ